MTNTGGSVITEDEHAALVDRASDLGRERGHDAGMWVTVDSDNAQRLLDLDDEGDFDVFDEETGFRSPLSGEYFDDWTPKVLLDQLIAPEEMNEGEEHDVISAFEWAYREAFVDEVLRMARYHAEDVA